MNKDEKLTSLYGKPTKHGDYKVGDYIAYMRDGQTDTGTIIWVRDTIEHTGTEYIVESDNSDIPEVVLAHEIVEGERRANRIKATSRLKHIFSEQQLIETLQTLPIPIHIAHVSANIPYEGAKEYKVFEYKANILTKISRHEIEGAEFLFLDAVSKSLGHVMEILLETINKE